MKIRLVVLALTLFAVASSAAGQCIGPCVTMEQLEGRWSVVGYVDPRGFQPWHEPLANVQFSRNPDEVTAFMGESMWNDTSLVTLDCSAIIAEPGLNKLFGPLRPESTHGTGCVEFVPDGLDASEDGFDCAAPCLFIHSGSLYEETYYFVYEPHTKTVPVEATSWAVLKALFED